MRNLLLKITFLMLFGISHVQAQSGYRQNFGRGWKFVRGNAAGGAWEKVSLPHTAKVEPLVVIKQFQGDCWYRKTFDIGKDDGRKTFLYFEGVMQSADVWINDVKVMTHHGGYLPFTVDATDIVKPNANNQIVIKVNNEDNPDFTPGKPLKDLDFNYYGGIYRNVYIIRSDKLYITDPVHSNTVAGGGIYSHFSQISAVSADGFVRVQLRNEHITPRDAKLKLTLTGPDKTALKLTSEQVRLNSNTSQNINFAFRVPDPKLWSVNSPNLYKLKVEIESDDNIVGTYNEVIGIRSSELKADGYYLNGQKMFIPGTNRHQEYPYVGYALSDEAQWRDAVKIKNAGFDLVRLSHYPQAEAFLDACDELGILVMTSIPGWQFFGNEKFRQHALQDVRQMARRDRNHASVVFWEVSLNESNMDDVFMRDAANALKEELPFGNNLTAGWMDSEHYDLFIPARQHGKAPDYWNNYNKGHRKIFIAEYGDWEYYAQNAGFNQAEFANLKEEERTSRQLRAFGEKRLLQQAFNFQEASNSNRKGSHTIGEANWLMFDYNRGYAPDIESSGISDIFRIPKFACYFYQSQRDADIKLNRLLKSGPMAHIASYWTSDSPLDVRVYSNCDEIALYLNDVLITRQTPTVDKNSDQLKHPPFIFKFDKFTSGTLRAEGYINGEKSAEHIVRTPGKASKIELIFDESAIRMNKSDADVVFVYAEITDDAGTVIPDAVHDITFSIEGDDAVLIGANPQPAEAGIATILLRTDTFKKKIKITAVGEGLKTATLSLQ